MKITNIDSFIEEFRNGRNIWSRASIELAVREISRLRKRNEELEANQVEEYQVPPESFNDLMELIRQGTKDGTIIIKNLTTTNAGLKQKRIEELEQRIAELRDELMFYQMECPDLVGRYQPQKDGE